MLLKNLIDLKVGERYKIDSGLGGVFVIQYKGKINNLHNFKILNTDFKSKIYNFTDEEVLTKIHYFDSKTYENAIKSFTEFTIINESNDDKLVKIGNVEITYTKAYKDRINVNYLDGEYELTGFIKLFGNREEFEPDWYSGEECENHWGDNWEEITDTIIDNNPF